MKDRTRKMRDYLVLPGLKEYVFVASKSYRIEIYRREAEKWVYYLFGPGDELELRSIGIRFPVMDVYRKVQLKQEDMSEEGEDLFS